MTRSRNDGEVKAADSPWDQDVDEEEEGYFEFDDKGWGSFHFGYVHGNLDCRLTKNCWRGIGGARRWQMDVR
jgi:hypothetical protein